MHRARSLARALFHSAARTYASILATTCCIRTALSSYDLDFVHPHKYDFAASIASCDVGLPRQSMQATSSIGLPQRRSSGATRISTARRLRSAARREHSCFLLVRGWGGNTRGAREKAGVRTGARARAQRQLSTREKKRSGGRAARAGGCEALEALLGLHSHWPPKTTDTSMTLSFLGRTVHSSSPRPPARGPQQRRRGSFGSAVLRGAGVRRRRRRRGRGGSVRSVCEPTNPHQ
ncbi:hypothetical protein B0H14DRAFT_2962608 [Mycena olivaceomarginata]|nr:hypothetical protein B0H14DRAFT_2962608 [Mycena olivaceomarginata]